MLILAVVLAALGWCAASAGWALWWVERQRYIQLVEQPIVVPAGGPVPFVTGLTVGKPANGLPPLQKAEVINPGLDAEARVLRAVTTQTRERTKEGLMDMAKRMGKDLSDADATKQAELLLALDAGLDTP